MVVGVRDPERRMLPTPDSMGWRPLARLTAVALLAGIALALRLIGMTATARDGGLRFDDPDTLRRLVRLRHLTEPGTSYPFRDPADGWYADPARRGTILHWTLPMDGVVMALDRVFASFHPKARRFESGAAWAAPVLGTLAVIAFFVLAARCLDPPETILATLFYALSYDVIANTGFGNGDHQSLQHLAAVVALLGFFGVLAGKGGRGLAVVSGAALGLGLWVSAETTVVFAVMAIGAVASLVVATGEERIALARRHCEWAAAALAVAAVGDRVEHPGAGWTFQWDTISGFQLHQLLVFLVFAVVALMAVRRRGSRWGAPAIAAGVALVAGIAPFVVSPAYRAALDTQLALANARESMDAERDHRIRAPVRGRGILRPQSKLGALHVARGRAARGARRRGARPQTPADGAGRYRRGRGRVLRAHLLEVKLGHLFAVVYPLVLVAGGGWLLGRLGRPARAIGAAVAVALFLLPRHPVVGASLARALVGAAPASPSPRWDDANPGNMLIRELQRLPPATGDRRAVLADWSIGAFIMYETDLPVVASGYHRNLAGIRDAYRVFVARIPEDVDQLAAILRERGVRWIVTRYDPQLFVRGSRSFPELGAFGRTVAVKYLGGGSYEPVLAPFPEFTGRTFLWRAHFAGPLTAPLRVGDQVISFVTDVPRAAVQRGYYPSFMIYDVRDASDGAP
jgi:hypothetical protein